MSDSIQEAKGDNDLQSSRFASQISTSRPMYQVGQTPIYISPKIMIQDCMSYETKNSEEDKKLTNHENSAQFIISDHKIHCHQNLDHLMQNHEQKTHIFILKFEHKYLKLVENMIFIMFLLGSLTDPLQLRYLDYAANAICLIKILTVHIGLFVYNSKLAEQEHDQKKIDRPAIFYFNRLELYELLQFWSIACTLCIILLSHSSPEIQSIVLSLRLIRLFFIFFLQKRQDRKWRAKVFVHILKITSMIFVATSLLSIAMQLMLYNIDSYYCLSLSQLALVSAGLQPNYQLQPCGFQKQCKMNQDCRNIFSYAETQQSKSYIQKIVSQQASGPFSTNFLTSMAAVMSSGSLYGKYRIYVMEWFLLPVIGILWLLYVIFTGIGIGQSICYESLEDWRREQQSNKPKQKKEPTKKKKRARNSNITFNSCKNLPADVTCQKSKNQQFSVQINQIRQELKSRGIKQKVATVVFNLICIMQIAFITILNLNLNSTSNTACGISLVVIFIIWSFGLGLALYERISSTQPAGDNFKNYVLAFQFLAYSIMLSDYAMRIGFGQQLFESSTDITPSSHAIISLRMVFVLFNNGFDAYISYYTEKIMTNFINKLPVVGFMMVAGVSIGLILAYNFNYNKMESQIELISNGISMVFGLGGSVPGSSLLSNGITVIIILIGVIVNFYIAKHINIGYDSLFMINFDQQSMQLPHKPYEQKMQEQPYIKKILKSVHQFHYYYKLKAAILLGYVGISLVFQQKQASVNLIKLCIDVYLLVDIVTQIIAYGVYNNKGYFQDDALPKVGYIVTQIILIVGFFVGNGIHPAILNCLSVSHSLLIFGCIPQLYSIYTLIKTIILYPKIKIYKIIIMSIPLLLLAMCLVSPYVGIQPASQSQIYNKLLKLVAYSTSYVYNLGWSFASVEKPPHNLSYLSLNIIFCCIILYLHIILTFMMVTFFVNRKNKFLCTSEQQILKQYQTSDPQFYHHELVNDKVVFQYIKVLKVLIICAQTVLIGMLAGNWLDFGPNRGIPATANLILLFIEIFIYIAENLFVKEGIQRWPVIELLFLLLSLPGTFFLIFPVARFSPGLQVNMIIRIFLCISMLRVFRLFPLLTNRSIFYLSSKLLRRVSKQLYIEQTVGIFIFIIAAILPFSTLQANLSQSNSAQQFVNFLTGSIFPRGNTTICQLIPKIICSILILFPIRTMLIARVISSFLNTNPNQLLVLRDQISDAISRSGALEKLNEKFSQNIITKQTLHLDIHQMYRFSAQIHRIFQQFSSKSKIKTESYNFIMRQIKKMNIPVYTFTFNQKGVYGVLVYDIIWNFFKLYKNSLSKQKNETPSLFGQAKHKKQNISRTHFGTHSVLGYLRVKTKISSFLLKVRDKIARQNNLDKNKRKKRSYVSQVQ